MNSNTLLAFRIDKIVDNIKKPLQNKLNEILKNIVTEDFKIDGMKFMKSKVELKEFGDQSLDFVNNTSKFKYCILNSEFSFETKVRGKKLGIKYSA